MTVSPAIRSTTYLTHNRIGLALHELAAGEGTPLLLLHGLSESTVLPVDPWPEWHGPIFGLDFTGHGDSTIPAGGGYTAELLLSDADVALAEIGPATVLGRGLGAYIALLIAGARPDLVRGAVLADGPGLAGGGQEPGSGSWFEPARNDGVAPDPFALFELSRDTRPPDYATSFVHLCLAASDLDVPLVVTAQHRPPWLAAVANEPGVVSESWSAAFARFNP